jgi:hypothetical protein
MAFARFPRARDDRTLDYVAVPSPHAPAPARRDKEDGHREGALERTAPGLGKAARSREEEHWTALYEQGLLNLDAIPVFLPSAPPAPFASGDEVEAYVLERIERGTTMRALVEMAPCPGAELMRTIGRLVGRKVIRLM